MRGLSTQSTIPLYRQVMQTYFTQSCIFFNFPILSQCEMSYGAHIRFSLTKYSTSADFAQSPSPRAFTAVSPNETLDIFIYYAYLGNGHTNRINLSETEL